MRQLTAHHGDPLNDVIQITPVASPITGVEHRRYKFVVTAGAMELGYSPVMVSRLRWAEIDLRFQDGPIEGGVNGLTKEALLAVLIDQLEGAQASDEACHEYGFALDHVRSALESLQRRTRRQASVKEAV